jgi:hypothetical protein|tara:strand:- start:893 stop:1153 length:261 start_codon:yes stop_codon:yes gene_type:complete
MENEAELFASTMAEELLPLAFFVEYLDATRRNWDEITAFKQAYQDDDVELAKILLNDIEDEDRRTLWRATTKGSVFTTDERSWVKR